jgi:RNA polymerase sporulation-specific sigma factor
LKTFPKPLSPQEEQQYLKLWQNGDKKARDVLIERNLRLVAHVIKKFSYTDEDMDDLLSIGTIGLIKAVNTYNPDKAGRLATYAGKCIENEILMFFRSKKKLSREVSLYDPIGTDKEGNEINLIDIIEAEDEDVIERLQFGENAAKLSLYMKQVLTPRELEIIVLRYGLVGGEEVTQREIARKQGISRSYVSRIEKKALRKLRMCFEEAGVCDNTF